MKFRPPPSHSHQESQTVLTPVLDALPPLVIVVIEQGRNSVLI